jgi:uncharacterized protein (UPF0276 family)
VPFNKSSLRNYGLGLGLRRSLTQETLKFYSSSENQGLLEWLEIVPENYIALGGMKAKQFQEVLDSKIPLIPHCVNLSIGTAPESPGKPCFDKFLIEEMHKLFDQINPPWFSDHLSCTRINGYYMQDLIPLPFTQETVNIVSDNVKFLQDEFQLPFLVENPSFYTTLIEPEMREAEFINSIMAKADCGMLLDVNNIYVNATNHDCYDPIAFLDELDLERVVQVHIAGHLDGYESRTGHSIKILDTHGDTIKQEVYKILEELLKRTEVNAILLERDSNFPKFPELVEELKTISVIARRAQPDVAIS